MPLSDAERAALELIEAGLEQGDPKLVARMRRKKRERGRVGGIVLGTLVFLIGMVTLVSGIELGVVVGIVGFLVMMVGLSLVLRALGRGVGIGGHTGGEHKRTERRVSSSGTGTKTRGWRTPLASLEARWEQRWEARGRGEGL